MTSKEVTELLGVTRMTLSNYVNSGKILIREKLSNKKVIYDDASVYKLLEGAKEGNKVIVYCNGSKVEAKLDDKSIKKIFDYVVESLTTA